MYISLCLPTHNRLQDLKRCLNSILDGFPDNIYEVIIADGGSTDGTLDYLKSLDNDNVKLIEQGKLTGSVKAFNACFKIAKGDYVIPIADDEVLVPKVLIKACKLMNEDNRIGLVGPKVQEPTRGNLPGVALKTHQYRALCSKVPIFRSSVLREINYFDESFRTYHVEGDSFLSVMKLGYTTIFTREVGVIHYRTRDESINLARAITLNKRKNRNEIKYFHKKWRNLHISLEEYLCYSPLKKCKSAFFLFVCNRIYLSKSLRPFIKRNHKIMVNLYDWLLEQAVVFKDKNYDHLRDFFLAQKYPNQVISSLN